MTSVYVVDSGNSATFITSFTVIGEVSSSSSGSGSSSGGGGGGGGGTNLMSISLKGSSTFVNKGEHISYEFKEDENAITSIQFDSLKNSGSIQAIVEVLKERSSFADIDVPGNIYQQMNIWVGKVGL
ncbi:MAG: PGF-pre-PGF domain-containing protein [Methanolobus sp.]